MSKRSGWFVHSSSSPSIPECIGQLLEGAPPPWIQRHEVYHATLRLPQCVVNRPAALPQYVRHLECHAEDRRVRTGHRDGNVSPVREEAKHGHLMSIPHRHVKRQLHTFVLTCAGNTEHSQGQEQVVERQGVAGSN
eukprot:CAMPEP_0117587116 /NCGR_PEP_ID=MMETSP0784-20121206/69103_1 /TAXON_ID=39447 /ORGANISM="" /LENGTH=135 /DNA_ID=CAMNT_0005388301 /DNA_START=100 /DNA_END=507 /DNA_ORIENTATION=-